MKMISHYDGCDANALEARLSFALDFATIHDQHQPSLTEKIPQYTLRYTYTLHGKFLVVQLFITFISPTVERTS